MFKLFVVDLLPVILYFKTLIQLFVVGWLLLFVVAAAFVARLLLLFCLNLN